MASTKAHTKAPAMKAPTCKVDGTITVTLVKRKTFSKTKLQSYKELAISAEETVIAWEENSLQDLKAFVAQVLFGTTPYSVYAAKRVAQGNESF